MGLNPQINKGLKSSDGIKISQAKQILTMYVRAMKKQKMRECADSELEDMWECFLRYLGKTVITPALTPKILQPAMERKT